MALTSAFLRRSGSLLLGSGQRQLLLTSPLVSGQSPARAISLTQPQAILGRPEKPTKVEVPGLHKGGSMSHSMHWKVERYLTVAMVPLYPAALFLDGLAMNVGVGAAITMHVYWGIKAVIKDYAMERLYGPSMQKVLYAIWKLVAAVGFAGYLYFCFTDVGFIRVVKDLWTM